MTIYARVSSHDQKEDLERQVGRLKDFAAAGGLRVKAVVEEIGSGPSGRRAKLVRLLKDPNSQVIVVEHRDRLARFGVEYIEAALMSQGRSIIVIDDTEEMVDIWTDFMDVVTSMCERSYGKRTARNRARKALVVVPRFEATSKPCSKCGWVKDDLTLSDRVFVCESCGHTADRDDNASDNVLLLAVSSTERLNGRGGEVRPAGDSGLTPEKRQSECVA